jgi:hypothetical protein
VSLWFDAMKWLLTLLKCLTARQHIVLQNGNLRMLVENIKIFSFEFSWHSLHTMHAACNLLNLDAIFRDLYLGFLFSVLNNVMTHRALGCF